MNSDSNKKSFSLFGNYNMYDSTPNIPGTD